MGSGWARLNGINGRLTAAQIIMFTPRRVKMRDVLKCIHFWPWGIIAIGVVIGALLGILLKGI